ncbi:16S rRNA (guanine(527)-N(7))-methyltransferase RsmG [uncultured Limnohabitans sp.]|jgi:16S rRNA (guanine527-N7)-methyltransferase|uniref:16S rRNA (guanine(527)-N(7))-methyltransferase RsmG n=1 Tax=uncultured Limnohabitans sp. TaxID=768543 RepID=UPI001B5E2E21|nr:16S rRNA (guanine(527)-N(7))-methyltransferase RsmG [uncultured Limnohabitans sp.]MBP6221382.1 16S rRNA (guanine(527)-N(7))-methyltransferase RsmG [Limnohabitans sp.]
MSVNLASGLSAGIQALGLNLSDDRQKLLLDYVALIQKWNKVYNLTALRDPADMLSHHLLDSLTAVAPLARHTQGQAIRVLDVGSGGGLPGVVLAICMPELNVTCVDTVAKKAAFVQQVAVSLKLPNLRGIHARVESLTDPYQVICSRAFASLPDFVSWSRSALAEGGVWMAMKGKHPQDEIKALPSDVKVFHVEPLAVPGLDVERCMVWMKPEAASPV